MTTNKVEHSVTLSLYSIEPDEPQQAQGWSRTHRAVLPAC